jgi:hypothetical protein
MTDVQVPASAVQPALFEEVAAQFLAYLRASGMFAQDRAGLWP